MFVVVGNELGKFHFVEDDFLHREDKWMARILVEIDIHVGLMQEVELEWQGQVYFQPLNYWGIPLYVQSVT